MMQLVVKYTYKTNCIKLKFDVTLMQLVRFDAIGFTFLKKSLKS